MDRIQFLDAHRGLAILLVIGYHAYARYPDVVPYGAQFANFPLFKAGWLGVNLFFLISGFVILMTLEKCARISDFLYRRWIRLFPAMLVCSLLIFSSVPLFPERPGGTPGIDSLVPGLLFVDHKWLRGLFGFPDVLLEGAFWSLYVEFKFYVFAALIYFWRGAKTLIASLFTVYILTMLDGPDSFLTLFSFQHFGWFAAGSAFYLFSKTTDKRWLYAAIGMAMVCSALVRNFNPLSTLAACAVSVFFAYSIVNQRLQIILSNRLLLWFGFISYPLYLIHENLIVAITVKIGTVWGGWWQVAYPLGALVLLSAVAYLIARHAEGRIKRGIVRMIN